MQGDRLRLPQALFMDFDGVILDSNRIKSEGFRELFKDYDDEVVVRVVEYHQLHGGISRVDKIIHAHENIIKKPLSGAELDVWVKKYSSLVLESVIAAPWVPGAREFLEEWPAEIPLFVISGTPEEELLIILEKRNMRKYFTEILGSPVKKVPHIKMLLGKYKLDPGKCLFVGDALTDYNGARETGLAFIGIQGEITFPEGTPVFPDCRELRRTIQQMYREKL